jgi:hypothetical protein
MKWASRKAATIIRDITSWRRLSSAERVSLACWKTKTEAFALRFFHLAGHQPIAICNSALRQNTLKSGFYP